MQTFWINITQSILFLNSMSTKIPIYEETGLEHCWNGTDPQGNLGKYTEMGFVLGLQIYGQWTELFSNWCAMSTSLSRINCDLLTVAVLWLALTRSMFRTCQLSKKNKPALSQLMIKLITWSILITEGKLIRYWLWVLYQKRTIIRLLHDKLFGLFMFDASVIARIG